MSDQTCVRNFILYEYITRTIAMASGLGQNLLICSMCGMVVLGTIAMSFLLRFCAAKKIASNDMAIVFPFIQLQPSHTSVTTKTLCPQNGLPVSKGSRDIKVFNSAELSSERTPGLLGKKVVPYMFSCCILCARLVVLKQGFWEDMLSTCCFLGNAELT